MMVRALLSRRWSSAALAGSGLVAGLIGVWSGTMLSRTQSFSQGASPRLAGSPTRASTQRPATDSPAGAKRTSAELMTAWRSVVAETDSPVRNAELARLLTALATMDPPRALALSLAETNLLLRQNLLTAALRGWASVDPNAASAWALQRPFAERSTDIGAVLAGVTADPIVAIELANHLIEADPALTHDHGCSLLFALAHRGAFSAAARFAGAAPAAQREAWLDVAFTAWAEHQPREAATAAAALSGAEHETAFRAVMTRWSVIDPPAAVEFSLGLRPEAERRLGLSSALAAWATADLPAASAWLNQREPTSDLDAGVAAVATSPALANFRPLLAVNWAESIFAPEVRAQALSVIVQEWAKHDGGAAMAYVLRSTALSAADRGTLRARLKTLAGNSPTDEDAGTEP